MFPSSLGETKTDIFWVCFVFFFGRFLSPGLVTFDATEATVDSLKLCGRGFL